MTSSKTRDPQRAATVGVIVVAARALAAELSLHRLADPVGPVVLEPMKDAKTQRIAVVERDGLADET